VAEDRKVSRVVTAGSQFTTPLVGLEGRKVYAEIIDTGSLDGVFGVQQLQSDSTWKTFYSTIELGEFSAKVPADGNLRIGTLEFTAGTGRVILRSRPKSNSE